MTALIAITVYGTDEHRHLAPSVGFDHFLVKPVLFNNLLSLIRSSLSTCNELVQAG
jgi:hypothetical protein